MNQGHLREYLSQNGKKLICGVNGVAYSLKIQHFGKGVAEIMFVIAFKIFSVTEVNSYCILQYKARRLGTEKIRRSCGVVERKIGIW